MKSLAAVFLALVTLTCTPTLHADPFSLNLKTGTAVDTLIETPIAGGDQFTYSVTTVGLFSHGDLGDVTTSTFTATFVDIAGIDVLNFTDLCATVVVIGKAIPCQQFALSFTDLALGDASLVAELGANVNVGAGLATFGGSGLNPDGFDRLLNASLSLGSGKIDFSAPPTPPCDPGTSPVPEPGTMSLMATGLLSAAGVIRKRCIA